MPSPRRMPRSRSGSAPRCVEERGVAVLGRAVGEDEGAAARGRRSPTATSAAAPAMKPSTMTTRPGRGGAEHRAGHHRDLEAAVLGERRRRAAGAAAVRAAARARIVALAGEAGVVEAGAAADERVERQAGELVGDERGGRGVADAHLAEGDGVPVAVAAERAADGERAVALGRGHRRLARAALRVPGADAAREEVGVVDRRRRRRRRRRRAARRRPSGRRRWRRRCRRGSSAASAG